MTLFVFEPNKYAPTVTKVSRSNKPGEVVGMICETHNIAWTCSPHREDQRTGSTSPRVPMSDYWRSMFDAVRFK